MHTFQLKRPSCNLGLFFIFESMFTDQEKKSIIFKPFVLYSTFFIFSFAWINNLLCIIFTDHIPTVFFNLFFPIGSSIAFAFLFFYQYRFKNLRFSNEDNVYRLIFFIVGTLVLFLNHVLFLYLNDQPFHKALWFYAIFQIIFYLLFYFRIKKIEVKDKRHLY